MKRASVVAALAALFFLTGSSRGWAGEGWPPERRAKVMLARLFPKTAWRQVDNIFGEYGLGNDEILLPVHRKGQVGFALARSLKLLPAGKGQVLLAFELVLSGLKADQLDEALRTGKSAEDSKWTRAMAVVLLSDRRGKFLAKPEGFPILRPFIVGCMGDFCSYPGLLGLDRVGGAKERAFLLRYRVDRVELVRGLAIGQGKIVAGEPFMNGYEEDLSGEGCAPGARIKDVKFEGRKVTALHEVNCRCQKGCPASGVRAKRVTLVSLP